MEILSLLVEVCSAGIGCYTALTSNVAVSGGGSAPLENTLKTAENRDAGRKSVRIAAELAGLQDSGKTSS